MEKRIAPEEIEALIMQFQQSGCAELHVVVPGLDIHLLRDGHAGGRATAPSSATPTASVVEALRAPAPVPAAEPAAAVEQAPVSAAPEIPPTAIVVPAPYLGSFYRAPKPGEPPYVEVGSQVTADSDLCLLEVMKLFTALKAGVSGKVIQILAKDGQMVAEGEPLFVIDGEG